MFIVFNGQYGSGKTLSLSEELYRLCTIENRMLEKDPLYPKRRVLSNLALSQEFKDWYGADLFVEWKDAARLPDYKNVIIVWDEVTVDMDATQWETMPHSIKVWLRQIRKLNVTILATAQSFSELNRSARRRVACAYFCRSFFSSPTPTDYNPTPPVHGVVWRREIARSSYFVDEDEMKFADILGSFMLITQDRVSRFSTLQMFEPGVLPPLTHQERHCETCGYRKTVHY